MRHHDGHGGQVWLQALCTSRSIFPCCELACCCGCQCAKVSTGSCSVHGARLFCLSEKCKTVQQKTSCNEAEMEVLPVVEDLTGRHKCLARYSDTAQEKLWLLQLVMEEKRFATVMWGGFDFIADAGGSDPDRREWLMECSGLQASSLDCNIICIFKQTDLYKATHTCCCYLHWLQSSTCSVLSTCIQPSIGCCLMALL